MAGGRRAGQGMRNACVRGCRAVLTRSLRRPRHSRTSRRDRVDVRRRALCANRTCGTVEPQDLNVLHGDCGVRFDGDTLPRSLFGTVIERRGRFKFVSYANGL